MLKSSIFKIVCHIYDLLYKAYKYQYIISEKKKFAYIGQNVTFGFPNRAITGHEFISIEDNVTLNSGLWLSIFKTAEFENPYIKIGKNVCVNYNCQITGINGIVFGKNVLIGSNTVITDHLHGQALSSDLNIPPVERKLYSKGPVLIGDNVWIGANVTILSGVTIGDNCIIGANSVVTKSFQPNSIIGGNPARVIRVIS